MRIEERASGRTDMDKALATLRSFVETILDDERDIRTLGGPILHYGIFVRQILNSKRPEFMQQRDLNQATQVATGAAVSPWHAAMCMEDRSRTAAFIRGSIRAVEYALECSSQRPLHLLEAGCGPLGTLVLPLLAHFDSDELMVSLIDLHEESIECVKTILDHFDFLPRTRRIVTGDILTADLGSSVDVVLTETMNTALSHEPQVAITRALLRRHRGAILIPQSIRVDCALLDIATESSQFPPRVCEREVLATVFGLNRESALELVERDGFLPAARVEIPDQVTPGFVPCLTTTIQVFEDTQIGDYETQISFPIPLHQANGPSALPGTALQFAYRMGGSPGLVWTVE